MKSLAILLALTATALAQPITGGGDMPLTLDPGSTGTQNTPGANTGAGRQTVPKQPDVVVVGPDGKVTKVTNDGGDGGPHNFYVGGDGNPAEPDQIHSGPTPELHVVRRGDTLWDICWYYFNDPWQWPKIWSYNPQITNPHWIYPGDLVRLLPRGVFANTPETNQPEPNKPDNAPPPAKRSDVTLKQVAFVEQSDLDKSITIDGAVDEKVLLGEGDEVYLSYPANKPPEVGQKYTIYEPGNKVKGYGAYVRILGELEVVSVKEDKRARGRILEATREIERGAKVGPLIKTFKNVEPKPPEVDAQGEIVAMIVKDQLIGQGEIVMVNLGKKSGVVVGNRMFVVRRGDALEPNMDKDLGKDDRRFPARALGEVVIVEVGESISVGLVTLAVKEMGVGDLVMMQKSGGAK